MIPASHAARGKLPGQFTLQVRPGDSAVVFLQSLDDPGVCESTTDGPSQAIVIADSTRLLKAWRRYSCMCTGGVLHRLKASLQLRRIAREDPSRSTTQWQTRVICASMALWRTDPRFQFAHTDLSKGLYSPAPMPRVKLIEGEDANHPCLQVLSGEGHLMWLMAHDTPHIPVQCTYDQAKPLYEAIGAPRTRIIALDDIQCRRAMTLD